MTVQNVAQFIETYNLYKDDAVQHVQLQHRLALVEAFDIQPGMHVLEIGCGQGDTTMILADAVGEHGHVTAIDIASPDYGAPTTLGQAHAYIQQSSIGERMTFHLETDFLTFTPPADIDIVVLSHCSWYFASREQLVAYFTRMHDMNVRVCVAEWDMAFTHLEQRSHFCAASILALYSSFIDNDGNIQHVWSKEQLRSMAQQAGFTLTHETIVDARFLQDGAWEKDYANYVAPQFSVAPPPVQALVQTYYDVMNSTDDEASLNSFVQVFST